MNQLPYATPEILVMANNELPQFDASSGAALETDTRSRESLNPVAPS